MKSLLIAATAGLTLIAHGLVGAQNANVLGTSSVIGAIVLVDSTGKIAARPLDETIMLVSVGNAVAAPALIGPLYDRDGHAASGLATWQAGGSVLFTSPDCTTGAHVHSSSHSGVRATTQVQTPAGIVLYVGAIGTATAAAVQSILYDTGCAQVTVQQKGLLPVVLTVNLSTVYPPPLSFQ